MHHFHVSDVFAGLIPFFIFGFTPHPILSIKIPLYSEQTPIVSYQNLLQREEERGGGGSTMWRLMEHEPTRQGAGGRPYLEADGHTSLIPDLASYTHRCAQGFSFQKRSHLKGPVS